MKKFFLVAGVMFISWASFAQKMISRDTYVHFYSATPVEDIEASLKDGIGLLNTVNNQFVFQLNIASFTFEKALMQEHFNENYMESSKYPKGIFKGTLAGNVDYNKAGRYSVTMKGQMTIHGRDREMAVPATVNVTREGLVEIESTFVVKPSDHDIVIPSLVANKIAKEIEVKVKSTLRAM